jgi:hypothetical protein
MILCYTHALPPARPRRSFGLLAFASPSLLSMLWYHLWYTSGISSCRRHGVPLYAGNKLRLGKAGIHDIIHRGSRFSTAGANSHSPPAAPLNELSLSLTGAPDSCPQAPPNHGRSPVGHLDLSVAQTMQTAGTPATSDPATVYIQWYSTTSNSSGLSIPTDH